MSPRPAVRLRTRGTLSFYWGGGRARRKTSALNGGGLFIPAISALLAQVHTKTNVRWG